MPSLAAASLAAVARLAGVAPSTASLALRDDARVRADTRDRVRDAAKKLGYRADPRVGSLMARIRRARPLGGGERVALVWVSAARAETLRNGYLRSLRVGATRRAGALGFRIEEFWLEEDGMSPARLEKILRARGITGVVFSAPMREMEVRLDWDWSRFAAAVIGNSEWHPPLHRVGHHHYRSMWTTMERLRAEGRRRLAAILHEPHHRRIHGVHQAAFLANHPLPSMARNMARFDLPAKLEALRPWFRRIRADALICVLDYPPEVVEALRAFSDLERIVTLGRSGASALPGVDPRDDLIAEGAVDLVLAQLHRNERGVPEHPLAVLMEGEWRE